MIGFKNEMITRGIKHRKLLAYLKLDHLMTLKIKNFLCFFFVFNKSRKQYNSETLKWLGTHRWTIRKYTSTSWPHIGVLYFNIRKKKNVRRTECVFRDHVYIQASFPHFWNIQSCIESKEIFQRMSLLRLSCSEAKHCSKQRCNGGDIQAYILRQQSYDNGLTVLKAECSICNTVNS